jgi:hypothetical protein
MRIWYESTGRITASAKSDRVRPTRKGEKLLTVDDTDLGQTGEYIIVDGKIVENPDYIEPESPRDLAAEIDELKAQLKTK